LRGLYTTSSGRCLIVALGFVELARPGELGGAGLSGIVVTLHESHIAWASYEVDL
jgi:hypothetical protein